jgi:allantoinase
VTVVRSTRVLFPDGDRAASIHISDGTIDRIAAHDDAGSGRDLFDAGDLVVSPGIVDTHVHVNEPGRTEWEGFATATRAAAAGGVTTIVDMPLNSIPATTTVEALAAKRTAARGRCHVDVAFWGGVVPGNASEIDGLIDAGVRGFKCFLVPSGVDQFPPVDEASLREAVPILARRNVPLLVHAESPHVIANATHPANQSYQSYQAYLTTRPPEAEVDAIRLMSRLAKEFGVRTHIVHVACAEGVDEIVRAKAAGAPITAETCPHYLTFAAEEIPDGATEFKCTPPIREARHREALWNGLVDGALDLVATDHSPAPPSMKPRGDFQEAWGGIASLELSLAAVWTGARERLANAFAFHALDGARRPQPRHIIRWLSDAPARLAGLDGRKGRIAAGYDADLVVWDPEAETTIDPSRLEQRHKLTPYAGRRLRGVVRTTFVRGIRVWHDGRFAAGRTGRLL